MPVAAQAGAGARAETSPPASGRAPSAAREFERRLDRWSGRHTKAAAALGAEVLAEGTGIVGRTHLAVADRIFRLIGPPAAPVHVAHDAISGLIYGGVRGGMRAAGLAGRLAGSVQQRRERREGHPGYETPPLLQGAVAAVCGLIGDRLVEAHSALAIEMGLHDADGEYVDVQDPLPHDPEPVPEKVVLFIHGLCESERAWFLRRKRDADGEPVKKSFVIDLTKYDDVDQDEDDTDVIDLVKVEAGIGAAGAAASHVTRTYLDAVADDGWAAYALRYNTGLPIWHTALALAELLEELATNWPGRLDQLALVGHSMGGLVARVAVTAGKERGHKWVRQVSHLTYLGSPHAGAPLARAATRGSKLLAKLPETSALGSILEYRSKGIRDLDHGLAPPTSPASGQVPALLAGARHLTIAGALTRSCDEPLAEVIGDLLVTPISACGGPNPEEIGFDPDGTHKFGRMHHFRLLNDGRIEQLLRAHLALSRPEGDEAVVDEPAEEAGGATGDTAASGPDGIRSEHIDADEPDVEGQRRPVG